MFNKIIDFWFTELEPKQWWQKNEAFDLMIQARFGHYTSKRVRMSYFHGVRVH